MHTYVALALSIVELAGFARAIGKTYVYDIRQANRLRGGLGSWPDWQGLDAGHGTYGKNSGLDRAMKSFPQTDTATLVKRNAKTTTKPTYPFGGSFDGQRSRTCMQSCAR